MSEIIIVTAAFDAADSQWVATSRDAAGLRLTAESWTQLVERLPAAVHERLSPTSGRRREVSIEVILHTSLNVTVEAPTKYHIGHSMGPARLVPSTVPSILWADEVSQRHRLNEALT
jgi:hypothetical protein